jgi:hypothetical protein
MTKPSKKKAASRSRKPARKVAPKAAPKPVEVVTEEVAAEAPDAAIAPAAVVPAPDQVEEPTVEELKEEISKFDHDGDGHVGGSLPHHPEATDAAEQTTDDPEAANEGEASDSPEAEAESAPKADEADEQGPEDEPSEPEQGADVEAPPTDDRVQKVSLGPVECRMMRVPLGAVLGLLGPEGSRRIEAHKSSASFESTRQRLLATDGRATPVIFEAGPTENDPPSILHGYEELAAADESGVNEVHVILVPPGEAPAAQSFIVEMVRQQSAKPTSNDDELFYRVHAEG